MSKKKKRKRKPKYTRKQIRDSKASGSNSIITELAQNLLNGDHMSLAEAEAASSLLRNSRPEGSICKVDLGPIPGAQNFRFIELFHAYWGDLEGKYGIRKFSGEIGVPYRPVSLEEKKEDVIRLDEYYRAWEKHFDPTLRNRHTDQILNLVVNEVHNDLAMIESEFKGGHIGKTEYDYKRKGTILLSKFIYLRVTSIFEDLHGQNLVINFGGRQIEITPWSMVHILNRHYAPAAKQYNTGKSFHQDGTLKFFEDPEQLKEILEKLALDSRVNDSAIDKIYFKFNGVLYSIHTKLDEKHSGGKINLYNRLQTFYPVEELTELKTINDDYDEVILDAKLSAYVKR